MASSAVLKVPSQTRRPSFGSRISAAYLPHGRRRTPRNRRAALAPADQSSPPHATNVRALPAAAALNLFSRVQWEELLTAPAAADGR